MSHIPLILHYLIISENPGAEFSFLLFEKPCTTSIQQRRGVKNVKLNLAEVQEPTPRMIKSGKYEAILSAVQQKASKNGTTTFDLVYKVTGDGEFRGFEVWDRLTLSKESCWKIKSLLQSMGEDVSGEVELDEKYLQSLVDRNLLLTVNVESSMKRGILKIKPKVSGMEPVE